MCGRLRASAAPRSVNISAVVWALERYGRHAATRHPTARHLQARLTVKQIQTVGAVGRSHDCPGPIPPPLDFPALVQVLACAGSPPSPSSAPASRCRRQSLSADEDSVHQPCPALGFPRAGLRAVPGAHQGQGRAWRRLRQAQNARSAGNHERISAPAPRPGARSRRVISICLCLLRCSHQSDWLHQQRIRTQQEGRRPCCLRPR